MVIGMKTRVLKRIESMVGKGSVMNSIVSSEPRQSVSSALFTCEVCDKTYIDTDMESCPECEASVEEVPSEIDACLDSPEV